MENFAKEEMQNLLDTSSCYKEVLEKMGLSPIGNNYNTLNKFIELYSLSTEKINKNRKNMFNNIDDKRNPNKYNTKDKFLSQLKNGTCTLKSSKILQYLIQYGIKKYTCEKCGIDTWNGNLITLELHHKNGNHKDNNLENLEILCPNCHSQTENFRFKNKAHIHNGDDVGRDICTFCNKNYKLSSAKMCLECRKKEREKNIPPKETIKALIRKNPFTVIARMYGVSDNAIRKWCKKYELPYKTSDIHALSNEEWELL